MKKKADLHIHTTGKKGKELEDFLMQALEKADKEGLEAVSMFDRNDVSMYLPGGELRKIAKSGKIEKIASKTKVVPGTEMSSTITDAPHYNKYTSHIGLYGFDAEKISDEDMLNSIAKDKNRQQDAENLWRMLVNFGLRDLPMLDYEKDLAEQIFNYIERKAGTRTDKLSEFLFRSYPSKSLLSRSFLENPNSPIFYARTERPTVKKVLEVGKENGSLRTIMHPAHMNDEFKTKTYIDAIMGISTKYGKSQIDAIEAEYFKNTAEETREIEKYAEKHNLKTTGGSDSDPRFGYNKRKDGKSFEMDEKTIKDLPDIRDLI